MISHNHKSTTKKYLDYLDSFFFDQIIFEDEFMDKKPKINLVDEFDCESLPSLVHNSDDDIVDLTTAVLPSLVDNSDDDIVDLTTVDYDNITASGASASTGSSAITTSSAPIATVLPTRLPGIPKRPKVRTIVPPSAVPEPFFGAIDAGRTPSHPFYREWPKPAPDNELHRKNSRLLKMEKEVQSFFPGVDPCFIESIFSFCPGVKDVPTAISAIIAMQDALNK